MKIKKNIIVTTDYNENVTNRYNINFLESFTRYPITAEIKAKFINNGEYDMAMLMRNRARNFAMQCAKTIESIRSEHQHCKNLSFKQCVTKFEEFSSP